MYPVINGGVLPSGYSDKKNESFNTITISQGGASAGYVSYQKTDFWAGAHCFVVRPKGADVLNNRYLYHFLKECQSKLQSKQQGAGIPSVNRSVIKDLQIPLPPLPIQEAIVEILDKFESLQQGLQDELQARKKQYEYYRNKLLTDSDEVKKAPLLSFDELCEKRSTIKWSNTSANYQYIDLSSVDIDTCTIGETSLINKESAPSRAQQIVRTSDILFGTTRPTQLRHCIIPQEYDGQICSTGFCILRPNKKIVNPKWMYYYIESLDFYAYIESVQSGAGYPCVSDALVKQFKISVPPMDEQNRIVSILDKFNALINSIDNGIPAEISAVKSQYEYFRNKLLTL